MTSPLFASGLPSGPVSGSIGRMSAFVVVGTPWLTPPRESSWSNGSARSMGTFSWSVQCPTGFGAATGSSAMAASAT